MGPFGCINCKADYTRTLFHVLVHKLPSHNSTYSKVMSSSMLRLVTAVGSTPLKIKNFSISSIYWFVALSVECICTSVLDTFGDPGSVKVEE